MNFEKDEKMNTEKVAKPAKKPIGTSNMQSALQGMAAPKPMFADGGEVKESPIIVALRNYMMGHSGDAGTDQRQAQAAANVDSSSGTVKSYADGGQVTDPMQDPLINGGFMMPSGPAAQLPPAPTPAAQPAAAPAQPNGIAQASQALANTPDTDPNIYAGMTADDRMALQQQLMSKMNSGAGLGAQIAGGIGDAVSNSFGGKDTHFQQDIMKNNQQQLQNKVGAVDTARSQRLEDVTGNQEAQLNDPNSPISASMRNTFKSAGINVASGMTGAQMMKIAPAIGDLAMKQATLNFQKASLGNTIENQKTQRVGDAVKEKAGMGLLGRLSDKVFNGSQMTKALDQQIAEGRGGNSGAPAVAHPQDSAALQWAQANPTDPRAAKIMSLNGN